MSDTPRTGKLLETILDRDGSVGPSNAPEEWVVHARQLERELAAANRKIQRLVEAGDKMASAWDKEWLTEADIEAIIDDWHEDKEAKP